MGRRRNAWLVAGNGVRLEGGKRVPGYYLRFNEYDAVGKRIGRQLRFARKADAERFVRQYNARRELRLLNDVVRLPLSEAVAEFLSGCSSLARDTTTHYSSALGFFAGHCGDKDVCDFSGNDVDRFVRARLRCSQDSTVAKHIRGLRRFFNWSISRGYATDNPVHRATAVPKGRFARVRPVVTEAMLEGITRAIDTEDRRLAVWIAATTGLDRRVIVELTPTQVDLEARVIRAVRRKRRATGQINAVPVHPDLAPLLERRIRETSPSERLLRGLSRQEAGRDWWKTATTAAGCPEILFRDLRAYAVQRGCRAGVSLQHLSRLLGHSTIQTTASHYTLPDPKAAQALGRDPLPGLPRTRPAMSR